MAKWWKLPEYDSYNEEYSESADLKKAEIFSAPGLSLWTLLLNLEAVL